MIQMVSIAGVGLLCKIICSAVKHVPGHVLLVAFIVLAMFLLLGCHSLPTQDVDHSSMQH
jgi:hypothetical protein